MTARATSEPVATVGAAPAGAADSAAALAAPPAADAPGPPAGRLLVAGVGNVLRGDDGFGPAVTELLGHLPAGVEVIETGIGGIALLQELMTGCDGLVLIDAVDRGAAPGTVFLLEPEVPEAVHVPDVHLANPDRVLTMAKTIGVCRTACGSSAANPRTWTSSARVCRRRSRPRSRPPSPGWRRR